MSRNILYVVIGILAIVAAVLGYQIYQDRQSASGIEIDIDEDGVTIETN